MRHIMAPSPSVDLDLGEFFLAELCHAKLNAEGILKQKLRAVEFENCVVR